VTVIQKWHNKYLRRSSKVSQHRRACRGGKLIRGKELQTQYSTYKETLQAIAQKIGDVEQEAEEHKSVFHLISVDLCVLLQYLKISISL